ncbi:cytochrome d ubiquinol oxidase subunit II [Diaphorobacter sp. HDW4A]|uniref:cytochrome d ubiquinol oxidase subunit II n=1 Tax=Diaphorobacter sp. HDW4A TaxID=2714924 RepID=UPI001407F59B|nr:cytochrome d ubiquinol oxidase subunit II [Diaphorobacter sp. HDW4A]QIL79153.1 cytochrome d ubiquinol oxidase subunit II [Diaphorobacter sp. HDW4A]
MILHELISYDVLRVIWWLLLGILLVGFAVMDGFDLGAMALLRATAKTDVERRVVINTVGPVWEGNQVWLILGGGAIFAAWPQLYAVSFSGFYLAMFVILVALILRPVAFKFRSKREEASWRNKWDWVLCISGIVPALIFGVAMGNVLLGVPFRFSDDLRIYYDGTFFGLLTPFALLCGLVSLSMLVMHGAAWLVFKTEGDVTARAVRWGTIASVLTTVLFALAGVWLSVGIKGYEITSAISTVGPSNPLGKTAAVVNGAWLANFKAQPVLWLLPALGLLLPLVSAIGMRARREWLTLLASGLAITCIILTVGAAMFPVILPSSVDPRFSLTVWDSSSSHVTLFNMLVCAIIFLPIILAYTTWVYRILRGKVDPMAIIKGETHSY